MIYSTESDVMNLPLFGRKPLFEWTAFRSSWLLASVAAAADDEINMCKMVRNCVTRFICRNFGHSLDVGNVLNVKMVGGVCCELEFELSVLICILAASGSIGTLSQLSTGLPSFGLTGIVLKAPPTVWNTKNKQIETQSDEETVMQKTKSVAISYQSVETVKFPSDFSGY